MEDAYNVCVSDFGLAKMIEMNESAEMSNQDSKYELENTLQVPCKWYAPECLTEQRYSHKSDVWSYGITMYEILTFCSKSPYSEEIPPSVLD